MIETADPQLIASKCEAIIALFPYAIWRERGGERYLFDVFLRLASDLGRLGFVWHHIEPLVATMLDEGSHVSLKGAIILAAPHFNWKKFANGGRLVKLWAAATSEVPYADNIGQSVVDTLLQIAHWGSLRPHIPANLWLWLEKRPSLPPVCLGRRFGTTRNVIQTVRDLGDIDTLKSYLLLVWSEWDHLRGASEMAATLREVFGEIGFWRHREDLLHHLDHILGELGRGFDYLHRHNPSLRGDDVMQMRLQYGRLRRTLLDVHGEAMVTLTRESPRLITPFSLPTHTDRMPLDVRVCNSSPLSIAAWLEHSPFLASARDSLLFDFGAFILVDPSHYFEFPWRCCWSDG